MNKFKIIVFITFIVISALLVNTTKVSAWIPSELHGYVYGQLYDGTKVPLPNVKIQRMDCWVFSYCEDGIAQSCGDNRCWGYKDVVEVNTDANGNYSMGNASGYIVPRCSLANGANRCLTGQLGSVPEVDDGRHCDGYNWCGFNCGSNPHKYHPRFPNNYVLPGGLASLGYSKDYGYWSPSWPEAHTGNGESHDGAEFVFVFTPPPVCTNPRPTCPIGSELLTNPGFDTNSDGWSYWSNSAPKNGTGSWERNALKNISYGDAQAGWTQWINAVSLQGKYVRVAANIYRNANMSYSPYIGINVRRVGSSTWEYNYGGITSVTNINSCQQISKDILMPSNVEEIGVFSYHWNAPAGDTYTDWLSLCQIPNPTNTPIPPTATNTPIPPTNTPRPTNTPIPPTSTPRPTNTPIPPTSTPRPTNTPIPTATPTPACLLLPSTSQYVTVIPSVSGTILTLNWSQTFPTNIWTTVDNVAVVVGSNQDCVSYANPLVSSPWGLSSICLATIKSVVTLPKTTTIHTVTNLTANTTYYYRIIYLDTVH